MAITIPTPEQSPVPIPWGQHRTSIEPVTYVQLAKQEVAAGSPDRAVALLRSGLDRCGASGSLWAELSRLASKPFHRYPAVALARRAVAVERDVSSIAELGWQLLLDGHYEEAGSHLQLAYAMSPADTRIKHYLALWHMSQWHSAEAVNLFEKVSDERPGDAAVMLDHSIALLQSGDMRRGLQLHESRWRVLQKSPAWDLGLPLWHGDDLNGKIIIVSYEQGSGDMICYSRFLPKLKARWPQATVYLMTLKPLLRLFTANCETLGVDKVLDLHNARDHAEAARHGDFHGPMMSVMNALGTSFDDIWPLPYLSVAKVESEHCNRRSVLNVGCIWATSRRFEDGWRRCPPLSWWCDLIAVPQLKLYSLQHGGSKELKEARADFCLTDATVGVADFLDLANAMQELDLVISVDTGPLHLAGALGVPSIALHGYTRCWRWQRPGLWYTNMTEFHLPDYGDWNSMGSAVKADLIKRLGVMQDD